MSTLRAKVNHFLLEQAFKNLSWAGSLHPRANPAKHGVEVVKDIPYRDSTLPEHRLDVYRPIKRDGPLPAVLYVHGGGFCILSKDTHWIMALAFARRGYVVFNINYRLAPKNKFPAAIEDVCHAWSWLSRNIEMWGGDPERVVVAGESAGANLSTALTVATHYERPEPFARAAFEAGLRPKVVVPKCGNLQVSDAKRFERRRSYPEWLLGQLARVERAYLGGVERTHDRFLDLADPLLAIERNEAPARPLPSFFVSCGTK
ncbi:MAG TPA: alpha/beta hydrolase, partial [Planctomycetota bacterium]|nr:alpha/beta hydrolase [Planctomycetota bacterium]